MRDRSDFLQGLLTGLAAGIGIAALLRTTAAQEMLASLQQSGSPSASLQASRSRRPYGWGSEYSQGSSKLDLQRQRPEAGGNPANLSPEKSNYSSPAFERPSGAPGSPAGAEYLDIPGQPGRTSNFSDAKRGVRWASRAIHMGETDETTE